MDEEEALNNLGLVATRKLDLYQSLIGQLPKEALNYEKEEKIQNTIADMANERFITEDELENGLNSENTLEDLSINVETLVQNLGYGEYFEEEHNGNAE